MNNLFVCILFFVIYTISHIRAQSSTDSLLDDPNVQKHTVVSNADELTISERDQGYAPQHIEDPAGYLDAKIYDLTAKLPGLIQVAKLEIEEKLRFTLFKKMTQGWSIVMAGGLDIFGDYVNNDYQILNTEQLYNYGFLGFYGMGFGFPALVGNPPLPPIDCGVPDYQKVLEKYGLSHGPLHLSSQFGVKAARSLISEFDKWIGLDLSCILDEEDNCESAADVKWALSNLIAAYEARLDLEESAGGYHGYAQHRTSHEYHEYPPTNSV